MTARALAAVVIIAAALPVAAEASDELTPVQEFGFTVAALKLWSDRCDVGVSREQIDVWAKAVRWINFGADDATETEFSTAMVAQSFELGRTFMSSSEEERGAFCRYVSANVPPDLETLLAMSEDSE